MGANARGPRDDRRVETANRLHSLAIHLLRRARREDALTGISPARLSALSVAGFGGPDTVSELSAAEGVSLPTMSRMVSALEADGLVQRTGDVRDGRIARLAVTEKGLRVLQEGRARRTAQVNEILQELSEEELESVDRAVEALERILGGPH